MSADDTASAVTYARQWVACRFPRVPLDEIESCSNLALARALRQYDSRKGGRIGYLRYKIRWGIVDELRLARIVGKPNVAKRPIAEVSNSLNAAEMRGVVESLREPGRDPEALAMQSEDAARLRAALRTLKPRWQRLLRLYYAGGLSLREAGLQLGIGEARASQIRKAAIARLREMLCVRMPEVWR